MNDLESSDLAVILIVVLLIVVMGVAGFSWFGVRAARQRAFLARIVAAEAAAQARAVDAASAAEAANRSDKAQEGVVSPPIGLRAISWNVQSDGNDPALIAEQLVELGDYDIIALQEVHSDNVGRYGNAVRKGLGETYRYLASNTGRSDRLMILFDSDRLRMAESRELFYHAGHRPNDWRHRSPLVAHFTHHHIL